MKADERLVEALAAKRVVRWADTNFRVSFEDQLLAAWATVTPPARSAIADHICDECEEISEFFGGRPWTQFDDVTALRYHSDALFLFTPAAYHYYLPAFIRATLRDQKAADVIPDVIFSTVRLEFGNSSRGRIELFSIPQRKLIAHFLKTIDIAIDAAEAEEIAVVADLLDH